MAKQMQSKPLSNTELAAFSGQMYLILTAGISASEGLATMLEDSENEEERCILRSMNEEMTESGTLYDSMCKAQVFPAYMLHMVQIGEETGTLDEVMGALTSHYTREAEISRSLKSALTYPLVMITLMGGIILLLFTKVMPIFRQVYRQLGQELTGISGSVMAISDFLSRYISVFVVILVLLILLMLYLTRTASGQSKLRKIGPHFRFTRTLYDTISICRFADGISLALKSGMTLERGMDFAKQIIENQSFLKKMDDISALLQEGMEFAAALRKTGVITGIHVRIISIAEKSGTLDEVMGQIAKKYEEETDAQIMNFLSILEPTLVIILSIVVGIILFAVLFPLIGIMSGL